MDSMVREGKFPELFHPHLEVSLPSLAFNTAQKWSFSSYHPIDVLLLRFDAINEWEQQIQTIFEKFKLLTENQTEKKIFGRYYRYFK